MGDGIPKGAGAGRNRKQFFQYWVMFCNRKSTQRQAGTTTNIDKSPVRGHVVTDISTELC